MSAPAFGTPASGPDAPKWRLARFLRVTVAKMLLAAYRTRVLDEQKVPATGGFILAGNHVSNLDPALLWCTIPRETHFVAKIEMFDSPIIGWGLQRFWAFPIKRGAADREAIQRATTLLTYGEPVAMFPEGTRRRADTVIGEDGLGEAHSGVAFIAMRAGVPVLPVGIVGTDEALPPGAKLPRFPRVTIAYGDPVHPDDFTEGGKKERLAAMTAEIMRRIAVARDGAAAAEGRPAVTGNASQEAK